MGDAVIRTAGADDLSCVLALYRHLHAQDLDPGPRAAAAWTQLLESGMTHVVVAERDGILVASCTLAVVPNLTRGARPYGVIENVVTHADHRRQGLGQAVLRHALGLAWAAECYKVTLATGSKREGTLRFYEAAGFERGGKTYFEIRRGS